MNRWINGSISLSAGDGCEAEKDLEKRLLVNLDPFPLRVAMAAAVYVRNVIFFPGLPLLGDKLSFDDGSLKFHT